MGKSYDPKLRPIQACSQSLESGHITVKPLKNRLYLGSIIQKPTVNGTLNSNLLFAPLKISTEIHPSRLDVIRKWIHQVTETINLIAGGIAKKCNSRNRCQLGSQLTRRGLICLQQIVLPRSSASGTLDRDPSSQQPQVDVVFTISP